jgi:hypothetical protein
MFFTKHNYIQINDDNGNTQYLTDITSIFKTPQFLKNSKLCDPYMIADGDTPESIALNAYDDSKMSWVILMVNGIKNIYNEWPLSSENFNRHIETKYSNRESIFLDLTSIKDYNLTEGQIVKTSSSNNQENYAEIINWNPSLSKLTVRILYGSFPEGNILYKDGKNIGTISRRISYEPDSLHHFESDGVILDPLTGYLQDYLRGNDDFVVTNLQYETKINDEKRSIVVPIPGLARDIVKNYAEIT